MYVQSPEWKIPTTSIKPVFFIEFPTNKHLAAPEPMDVPVPRRDSERFPMDGKSTSKSSKTKIKRNCHSLNKSKSSVNKNNVNNENKNLSVMGVNSNGLISKKESMLHLINELNPSILTVQETFARKKGLLKIQGYEIFERVRENKSGGGLLTAVDSSLDPVLVSFGENEFEILSLVFIFHSLRVSFTMLSQ